MEEIKKEIKYPEKAGVRSMFNNIAPTYDLLNHLLSGGIDKRWRKALVKELEFLKADSNVHILDVATGTADLAILTAKTIQVPVTGIDISEKMLQIGAEKIRRAGLSGMINLIPGDSEDIPFPASTFNAVIMAFGIRNFEDRQKSFVEFMRVMKPGAVLLILEFGMPEKGLIKWFYTCYFKYFLPFAGGIISGSRKAYRYLNRSVTAFPYGENFVNEISAAGFTRMAFFQLSGGIAYLYKAEKPII